MLALLSRTVAFHGSELIHLNSFRMSSMTIKKTVFIGYLSFIRTDIFVFVRVALSPVVVMLLLESIRSYLSEIFDIRMNVDYSFLFGNLNLSMSVLY